ncbi:Lrp/AsnC family transcriptional regulator [Sphingosinicella rhizophila]|uniref:Lrp/AsnC family transcriptional regulator n=1 Tax=Sphingosinicella rhizophila TaxID=3050082 RepID=A0ABU3Q5I8_9SPHN|nr:Lrp/AsnC family transcriptional regulator [Sphingosinicella sp. GR2756]MDT9598672.1 Lrp/AsnC family transcriptional regulator [Sphingosinicella sp. GR2756]
MEKLDALDLKLLRHVQQDASLSMARLAEEVGLSANACWKRVKQLENDGYIERRVALLNRRKLGLPVTVFVAVRTDQHEEKWLDRFAAAIRQIPEVVEFYRMSGDVDYMLKLICADIEDYDRIYKKIIRSITLRDVSAFFAMEQIKCTTEIPLDCRPD